MIRKFNLEGIDGRQPIDMEEGVSRTLLLPRQQAVRPMGASESQP